MHFGFKLFNNKYLEVELNWEKEYWSYYEFIFSWTRKQDHAGIKFIAGVYKLHFNFDIYDRRHWNYGTNKWE